LHCVGTGTRDNEATSRGLPRSDIAPHD
jgi:hypothetical protein